MAYGVNSSSVYDNDRKKYEQGLINSENLLEDIIFLKN
jgi:hypothetical protein